MYIKCPCEENNYLKHLTTWKKHINTQQTVKEQSKSLQNRSFTMPVDVSVQLLLELKVWARAKTRAINVIL